jgi:hypothetical protein
MFQNLSDAQVALLSNLLAKEAKSRRANLSPGTYSVPAGSFDLPGGLVEVGDDESVTPTVSVPLLSVLTIALHRAGFQRDGILSLVVEAATEAIQNGKRVGTELDTTAGYVAKEVKVLQARFAAELPKVTRAGKVRILK